MVLNCTGNDRKYIPVHLVASKLGLPIRCLLHAMHTISRCNSVNSFLHTEKITTFQTLKHKLDEPTGNVINFVEFRSHSLERPPVVTSIQYAYSFMRIN